MNSVHNCRPGHTVVALAAIATLLAASAVQASSIWWNINGGGNWNTTAANWTGDSTTFTDDGTVDVAFTNAVGGTITIAANMSPLSTTVDAPSGAYIFNSGPIDSGFLVKAGAGTLRLNNANTYPGGTFLKAGMLELYNNTAAGPGAITLGDSVGDADATLLVTANIENPIAVQAGSTGTLSLQINNADGRTFFGPMTLANSLTIRSVGDRISRLYGDITGVGNLTLTNASPTTRGTYLNLDMASVNPEGDLQIDGIGNVSVSAAIGGNVADITQNNSAFVFLSGANAYTGALTVNAGTLIFQNLASWSQNYGGVSAPTPVAVSNAGSVLGVSMGGAGRFEDADVTSLADHSLFGAGTGFAIETFAAATLSAEVNGSLFFEKLGPGANPTPLTMAGANTYKGTTRLTAGTLFAGVAENAGVSGPFGNPDTPAGSILFNGGRLGWSAANTTDYSSRFAISSGATCGFDLGGQTVTLAGALPVNGINGLDVYGDGTLVLSGDNTFSGRTQVHRPNGKISVASLNRVGGGSTTSNLGAPTTSANGTIVLGSGRDSGGQLVYTGTGETTDRIVELSGDGGGLGTIEHAGTGLLEFEGDATTGSAIALGGTTHNLYLQGSTDGIGDVSGAISGRNTGPSVFKTGTGTWKLSGPNTFVARTAIQQGVLSINSLGDAALTPTVTTTAGSATVTASSTAGLEVGHSIESIRIPAGRTIAAVLDGTTFTLNNGTGVTAGTAQASNIGFANSLGIPPIGNAPIAIGSGISTGQLTYTGSAVTTARAVNLAGTTGGATLDQSGSGLITFTSAFTATGAGSKTLTLQGSTAGVGEIAGAIVNNSATHRTSVNKLGSGTWLLSGVNTYTGPTTVAAGTLGGTGTIAGDVAVEAVAALAPGLLDSIGTLSVGGDVAFADGARLALDADAETADLLAVTGRVTGQGTVTVETSVTGTGPWLVLTAADIEPTFTAADPSCIVKKANGNTEVWLSKIAATLISVR